MFYVLRHINDFIFTAHVQKHCPDSLKCPEKCKRYVQCKSIEPLAQRTESETISDALTHMPICQHLWDIYDDLLVMTQTPIYRSSAE